MPKQVWLGPRDAALAFGEGARGGWGPHAFAAWCRSSLLASGFMTLRAPLSGRFVIVERGFEGVTLTTLPSPDDDAMSDESVRAVTGAARRRVVEALRGLLRAPCDDRFVLAALHSGRVTRDRGDRRRRAWSPLLVEGESLSNVVLALFAAEVLNDGDAFTTSLSVCHRCDRISFVEDSCRGYCPEHTSAMSGVREAVGADRVTPDSNSLRPAAGGRASDGG